MTDERLLEQYLFFCDLEDDMDDDEMREFKKIIDRFNINNQE